MLLLANTITADMGMIPGLTFVGPAFGLPLSVLAAFVERPFYTAGGFRRGDALWYSLQANLISLAAGLPLCIAFGLLMAMLGLQANDAAFFLVWPVLAVLCSVMIERWYLVSRRDALGRRRGHVSWASAAAGNIVSAAVCIGVLIAVGVLRETHPELAPWLRPYQGALTWVALGGSAATFVAAFIVPRKMQHAVGPRP